jgi:hypothetical protein
VKVIGNILYITFQQLVDCGVAFTTIANAKSNGSASWSFVADPADNRKVLIDYAKLKPVYQDLVKAKYGNPYEYVAATIIDQHLTLNPADSEVISNYKCPDGTSLPVAHQERYNIACKYLNLVSKTCPKTAKRMGFDTLTTFTNAVILLLKSREISLPYAYSKLKAKVREYEANGAVAVISKRYCNNNRLKVTPEGMAYITELFRMGNQFSADRVAVEYNLHAAECGWMSIAPSTVRFHLKEVGLQQQIALSRYGKATFREQADFVVKRIRPSRPNMLWVGDGTPFELYYQNGKSEWLRKVVYAVIDAFNDYVVGFSIGDTESNALAKLAWYNACANSSLVPDQIQTDNFGRKEMTTYYSQLAKTPEHFTPAAVGNARSKVVEQFFGKLNNAVTREFSNYAGNNITAVNQPNRDMLNLIKKDFPNEAGVVEQIQHCMDKWNTMPRPKLGNKSLSDQWQNGDHTSNRLFTDDLRLKVFGIRHSHTNRLTNRGINISINGEVFTYMLFTNEFADTIGMEYQVLYDAHNLSSIMVSSVNDDGRYRFVVPQLTAIPMAFGDHSEGTRTALNKQLDFKKQRIQVIEQRNSDNMSLVEAQGLTKMFPVINGTNKGLLHEANNVIKSITQTDRFTVDDNEIIDTPVPAPKRDRFDD